MHNDVIQWHITIYNRLLTSLILLEPPLTYQQQQLRPQAPSHPRLEQSSLSGTCEVCLDVFGRSTPTGRHGQQY